METAKSRLSSFAGASVPLADTLCRIVPVLTVWVLVAVCAEAESLCVPK